MLVLYLGVLGVVLELQNATVVVCRDMSCEKAMDFIITACIVDIFILFFQYNLSISFEVFCFCLILVLVFQGVAS